jgi:hypothetical protein
MAGVPGVPGVPEPPGGPERNDLIPDWAEPDLGDSSPGRGGDDLPRVPPRKLADATRIPDASTPETRVPDGPSFDAERNAREAQEMFHNELDISGELSRLANEKVSSAIKVRTDRAIREFDVLIKMGNSAPPSQVLVTVLLYADSENQVQESEAGASQADEEILQAIQGKFARARIPFWTALASLGKVKEWSASLEISAGFFAVKGTGGISVTFGK